jgi:6-phosphogluconolactonase
MDYSIRRSCLAVLAVILFPLVFVAARASPLSDPPASGGGLIFTETNATTGNVVEMLSRAPNGVIKLVSSFSTQGTGIGSDLNSQGALVLDSTRTHLYVVNAGSNDITAFSVAPTGLTFLNRIGSGGVEPVSLTLHGKVLYVANAKGTPNITGFQVNIDGSLSTLAGATAALSGTGAGPAQVGFNSAGTLLVVAERLGNNVDTFTVSNGIPSLALITPANSPEPFGFAFDSHGFLIISEAKLSSASSYSASSGGILTTITDSLVDFGGAACWTVVTRNRKFPTQYAYMTNTGSNSISGFLAHSDGSLTLLNSNGITLKFGQSVKPLDMTLDSSSNLLYVLEQSLGTIGGYKINSDGSLTAVNSVSGLPTHGTYGLAGY